MGSTTVVVALITVSGVLLSALVGGVGHVLARRSQKDDDVREWVELRFREQARENERLNLRIDGLERALEQEKADHGVSRQESRGLARYVREVWWWIDKFVPDELRATRPEPTGIAKEVMDRG